MRRQVHERTRSIVLLGSARMTPARGSRESVPTPMLTVAERPQRVTVSIRTAGDAFSWRTAQLAGSQVISLIRLMVLAKLLAPDAFAQVAVATVAIGVFLDLS